MNVEVLNQACSSRPYKTTSADTSHRVFTFACESGCTIITALRNNSATIIVQPDSQANVNICGFRHYLHDFKEGTTDITGIANAKSSGQGVIIRSVRSEFQKKKKKKKSGVENLQIPDWKRTPVKFYIFFFSYHFHMYFFTKIAARSALMGRIF